MDASHRGHSGACLHGKVLQVPDTEQLQDDVNELTELSERAAGKIFLHWLSDMHLLLLL